ncbi:hypothetical protein AAFF_G00382670 [Aldrovandia affinis]|uniref:Uncharacterized protein n=1 Tax=Aldrovandia affinis TaxID=143900 RepID=A0AAD7T8F2_9TELE|nr:hypothetical protein AAFF_G00382670 [Aldrovandia affinis]
MRVKSRGSRIPGPCEKGGRWHGRSIGGKGEVGGKLRSWRWVNLDTCLKGQREKAAPLHPQEPGLKELWGRAWGSGRGEEGYTGGKRPTTDVWRVGGAGEGQEYQTGRQWHRTMVRGRNAEWRALSLPGRRSGEQGEKAELPL